MAVSVNPNYSNISSNHGKLYVPVSPSKLIYSNFDHISGYKAKNGEDGRGSGGSRQTILLP